MLLSIGFYLSPINQLMDDILMSRCVLSEQNTTKYWKRKLYQLLKSDVKCFYMMWQKIICKTLFQACSRESSLMSTPQTEPARSKNKKSKTVEKYSPILEDISCVDDDFELTTKSKAHKKVKVNPKEAYGGNILKPR